MKISLDQVTALFFCISSSFAIGVLDQIGPIIIPLILNESHSGQEYASNATFLQKGNGGDLRYLYNDASIIIAAKNYVRLVLLFAVYKLIDRVKLSILVILSLGLIFLSTTVYLIADNFWKLLIARLIDGLQGCISVSVCVILACKIFPALLYSTRYNVFMLVLNRTSFILGDIVGPFFGGYIYAYCGRRAVFEYFFVIWAISVCAIALTWIIKWRRGEKELTEFISRQETNENDNLKKEPLIIENNNKSYEHPKKEEVEEASLPQTFFYKYGFLFLVPINNFMEAASVSGKSTSFNIWLSDRFHIDCITISDIWLQSGAISIGFCIALQFLINFKPKYSYYYLFATVLINGTTWIGIPLLTSWQSVIGLNTLAIVSSYCVLIFMDPIYYALVKHNFGDNYVGRAAVFCQYSMTFFNIVFAHASGLISTYIGFANFSYIVGSMILLGSFFNLLLKRQSEFIFSVKKTKS